MELGLVQPVYQDDVVLFWDLTLWKQAREQLISDLIKQETTDVGKFDFAQLIHDLRK